MKEGMNGKEFKEFVEFLSLNNIEDNDYLKDKPALEQLETLYKSFIYQRFCSQKIKEVV